MAMRSLKWSSVLAAPLAAWGVGCPGGAMGTPPLGHAPVPNVTVYKEALDTLDLNAVILDVEALLKNSQACWPADYNNYGPFFIRMAWHCSGTYRVSDGRGGCAGGRQRFFPESDWADNANLNYARALVAPIKDKYGDALSWGDLFITAGTAAIKSMGGPVTSYCIGRLDDPDGTASCDMGPTPEQEKYAPCAVNGTCKSPLGSTTVGLIYVNPEGPMGQPIPENSSVDVRDAFGRMAMNDRETVALIGGGHAFGKTHGACPNPPCGSGKGDETFTSGFEGPWTTILTKWSNEFFKVLQNNEWEKHIGPGGHWQWRVVNATNGSALSKLMRLTSDIALLHDKSYRMLVNEFADDQEALNTAFASAWFKLTTNGGKWATNKRCTAAGTTELITLQETQNGGGNKFGCGSMIGVAAGGIALGAIGAFGTMAALRRVSSKSGGARPASSDESSDDA